MAFLWILCLLTVCLAPGSQGQRMKEPDEEQQAAGAQLGESDVICHPEGCYAVFLEKNTFREARLACLNQGGTLVTMHTRETAGVVHNLLSASGVHGSRTRLRLWIGLHRPPRQCSSTKPLRGFVWITGKVSLFTFWSHLLIPVWTHFILPEVVVLIPTLDAGNITYVSMSLSFELIFIMLETANRSTCRIYRLKPAQIFTFNAFY